MDGEQQMKEWIDSSVELPQPKEVVLVFFPNGTHTNELTPDDELLICYYDKNHRDWYVGWYSEEQEDYFEHIPIEGTWWTEIPQKPTKENNGEV